MKTRFEIDEEVLLQTETLPEFCDYYEKHLKQYGFVLDKEREEIFKEYDKPILLNEGDRIEMDGIGSRIITWKCYNIDNDIMTYGLNEE
jgi:hypothetical protein